MKHINRSADVRAELSEHGFSASWQMISDCLGGEYIFTRYHNGAGKTVILLEVTGRHPMKDSSYWDLLRPLDSGTRQQDTFIALAEYCKGGAA